MSCLPYLFSWNGCYLQKSRTKITFTTVVLGSNPTKTIFQRREESSKQRIRRDLTSLGLCDLIFDFLLNPQDSAVVGEYVSGILSMRG